MQHPFRFLALCCVALLASCAAPRSPQPLPASSAAIEAFALDGRVAVKVKAGGNAPDRGYSAGMQWKHAPQRDSVRLLSPVGSIVALLEADDEGARLTTGDKQVYQSGNVEELTREVLGWDLPLRGLQHWVLGRAAPDMPVTEERRDARGRLSGFRQNGWRIAYLAYADESALPARMTLSHERLDLRLVVDRWDLGG